MYTGRTVFAQLMGLIPRRAFERCVARYRGEHRVHSFSCYHQLLCLVFAQLTYRESLRDIETCLRALQPKLYHTGLRGRIARSTLADANETRDWRIAGDFAQTWIKQHLRIKAFYGTSMNAVKTQVWSAISVYVLVAILKKELRLERSLYEILQILSLTLFERVPLSQVVTAFPEHDLLDDPCNQLSLFAL